MALTHDDLKQSISNKYPASHWILLNEVSNASGFDGTRSIDVVAFGLYSSRGYEVHAFECKAQRSDWLKELNQPDKADEFVKIVDKFWIVANKGVVNKGELPRGWGLIVASKHGDSVRTRIQQQATTTKRVDSPLPRPFVAAMLTRIRKELEKWKNGSVLQSEISNKLHKRYREGIEAGKREVSRSNEDADKIKEQVKAFEKASGLEIQTYTRGKDLGEQVALVEQLQRCDGWQGFVGKSTHFVRALRDIAVEVEDRVKDVEQGRKEMLGKGDME